MRYELLTILLHDSSSIFFQNGILTWRLVHVPFYENMRFFHFRSFSFIFYIIFLRDKEVKEARICAYSIVTQFTFLRVLSISMSSRGRERERKERKRERKRERGKENLWERDTARCWKQKQNTPTDIESDYSIRKTPSQSQSEETSKCYAKSIPLRQDPFLWPPLLLFFLFSFFLLPSISPINILFVSLLLHSLLFSLFSFEFFMVKKFTKDHILRIWLSFIFYIRNHTLVTVNINANYTLEVCKYLSIKAVRHFSLESRVISTKGMDKIRITNAIRKQCHALIVSVYKPS